VVPSSCEIVALWGKFCWQTGESDCSVLKVVYCNFLCTVWGIFLHWHSHTQPKARYQKISETFTYTSHTITNLTKFDFPLPHDQMSRSQIWQMISEKFKCGTFKAALRTMSNICKVSDGMRVVGKISWEVFDTLHWVRLCIGMEKYTQTVHVFSCTRNIQLLAQRIVALLSVNKILPWVLTMKVKADRLPKLFN
jgi:pterin-4a-carbinolamine dehydratase